MKRLKHFLGKLAELAALDVLADLADLADLAVLDFLDFLEQPEQLEHLENPEQLEFPEIPAKEPKETGNYTSKLGLTWISAFLIDYITFAKISYLSLWQRNQQFQVSISLQ